MDKSSAVGCCALLQGIFLTQGSTCVSYVSCIGRHVLYHQCHLGSPITHLAQFSRSVMYNILRPVDCSTPGFPVHHQIPEAAQTHVHQVSSSEHIITFKIYLLRFVIDLVILIRDEKNCRY